MDQGMFTLGGFGTAKDGRNLPRLGSRCDDDGKPGGRAVGIRRRMESATSFRRGKPQPVKDGLVMRLTPLRRRWACATLAASLTLSPGCHRLPYIDQTKTVPHDALGTILQEDREVKRAGFFEEEDPLSMFSDLPAMAPPRTTENPEAEEIWQLTLEEALRISLDNLETVRVTSLGAQGIPVQGFEPSPLGTGGAGQALGAGNLATVYDPAIQEAQIARALSVFDAQFQTQILWGRNVLPVNAGFQAGVLGGPRFPVIADNQTAQFNATLTKRVATGTLFQISQNITRTYTNNLFNTFPSNYASTLQFQFLHPLLGGDTQNGLSGLQANRAPIVIARLDSDRTVWSFKNSIMEHVRSVEQQYWALAQAHVQLWSRETAVELGQEIVRKEQAELAAGVGTIADVAEAEQTLKSFELQRIQALYDVINTERQLRNVMGLPPADNRRIVPATAPIEARVEVDWNASFSQMMAYLPDIVIRQIGVRVAELQLVVARNGLLPRLDLQAAYGFNGLGRFLDQTLGTQFGSALEAIDPRASAAQQSAGLNIQPGRYRNFENWNVGLTFSMPIGFRGAIADTKTAQYTLLQQRAYLQQTVHQAAHSLHRFFLEIDTNYKLFKTASELREAALTRLEVQKAKYEVGNVLIDRYLEAVNVWANAVSDEARFKTQYNISIIALEQAKGTLLAYNNIAVAEGPWPGQAYAQAADQQAGHLYIPTGDDLPDNPQPVTGRPNFDDLPPVKIPGVDPLVPPFPVPAPAGTLGPPPAPTVPARPAALPPDLTNNGGSPLPGVLPPLPGDRGGPARVAINGDRDVQPAGIGGGPGSNAIPSAPPIELPSRPTPRTPSAGLTLPAGEAPILLPPLPKE